MSPNQHHANSDRWMYISGGNDLELGLTAPLKPPHPRSPPFLQARSNQTTPSQTSAPGPVFPSPPLFALCLCSVALPPAGREGKGVVPSWASRAQLCFVLGSSRVATVASSFPPRSLPCPPGPRFQGSVSPSSPFVLKLAQRFPARK